MPTTDDFEGPAQPPANVERPGDPLPASPPSPSEQETDLEKALELAPTCPTFSVLDICEQAHRDVTKQPLCLAERDVQTETLRLHLKECPICSRWYKNACRAYERLASPATSAVPELLARYDPQPRPPVPIRRVAGGPGYVLQKLTPLYGAFLLDAMTVYLEWDREPRKQGKVGTARWWITMKLLSRESDIDEGNEEAMLKTLDGFSVRLEFRARGQAKTEEVVTRLGFDEKKNLVSIPRSLAFARPKETGEVTVTLLDRVEGIEGD
jgi:hypothetical protein